MDLSLEDIASIISVATALISGLWGVVQRVRARRYNEALLLAEDSLETVVAGVEVLARRHGAGGTATLLKGMIQRLAQRVGVESAKLADVVEEVTAELRDMGALDEDDGWLETRVGNALAKRFGERAEARVKQDLFRE